MFFYLALLHNLSGIAFPGFVLGMLPCPALKGTTQELSS